MCNNKKPRGRFITFEGGEGVGKSTQVYYALDRLRALQIEAVATREPGGSDGADQIRELIVTGPEDRWDALTETLLLFSARRDHVVRTIIPALESGIWVICDRFYDSTVAYQGYGHGVDRCLLRDLNARVCDALEPDLTFILDAPSELGISRAVARGSTEMRFERLRQSFHERARSGFLEIAKSNEHRCIVLDATASLEDVGSQVIEHIRNRLEV